MNLQGHSVDATAWRLHPPNKAVSGRSRSDPSGTETRRPGRSRCARAMSSTSCRLVRLSAHPSTRSLRAQCLAPFRPGVSDLPATVALGGKWGVRVSAIEWDEHDRAHFREHKRCSEQDVEGAAALAVLPHPDVRAVDGARVRTEVHVPRSNPQRDSLESRCHAALS
jgi:hypothetical protein